MGDGRAAGPRLLSQPRVRERAAGLDHARGSRGRAAGRRRDHARPPPAPAGAGRAGSSARRPNMSCASRSPPSSCSSSGWPSPRRSPSRCSRSPRRASSSSPPTASRSRGAARCAASRSMSWRCRLMSARPSSRSRTGASSTMSASTRGASAAPCSATGSAGRVREGGSTISQQLAKTSFTGGERTMGRKAQEALITLWLEARLSKEEILSRYISNVYFGNNIYGLRAAARFYFNVEPEQLTLAQAAMLAGLVNAPNRLAPNRNLAGAQRRARLVLRAMADIGFISEDEVREHPAGPARLAPERQRPDRHLFRRLDPVAASSMPTRRNMASAGSRPRSSATSSAPPSAPSASPGSAPARRLWWRCGTDGRIVAMLGGRDYGAQPVQPRDDGPPPGGLDLQAVRLSRRLALRPAVRIRWSRTGRSPSATGRRATPAASIMATSRCATPSRCRATSPRCGSPSGSASSNVIQAARDLGITAPIPPTIQASRSARRTSACSK